MSTKITVQRIKAIAKKLNIHNADLAPDELLNAVMDKIEALAKGKGNKWRSDNPEIMMLYNDAAEEMERMLEYEDSFF